MAPCFVLSVVVLFAIQGGAASITSELDALRNQTQRVIHRVEEAVENFTARVQELSQAAVARVEKKAQDFKADVQAAVQKLKDRAKGAVDGVEECFIGTPRSIAQLVENVTAQSLACVTDQVKEGVNISKTLYSLAKQANTTYVQYMLDYTACQQESIFKKPFCSVKTIGEVGAAEAKLFAEVTAAVTKGEALIAKFRTTVETCELSVWRTAPGRAAKAVLNGVRTCLGIFSRSHSTTSAP